MAPLRRYHTPWLVGLAVMLTTGCVTSTKLVTSWTDPAFQQPPFQRILVVAVMDTDLNRRAYEQRFAERITRGTVTGIAGHTLMPDEVAADDETALRDAVTRAGADGVLLTRLIEIKEQERYVPPSVDYVPGFGYGFGYYDYYGMAYQSVYRPGYTTIDTIVSLETTVFAVSTQKMVWAGGTRSFNPNSAQTVIDENADLIVASMQEARML